MEDTEVLRKGNSRIDEISEFLEIASFNRIINKLTDYAEILSEGKLVGLINFNYKLNSMETTKIVDLLISVQAISRIHALALKGSRDLESEYISNIFSDTIEPGSISSYVSLRTLLENRLSHQTQQYNMNMGKNNTTLAMPLNELRGHVKTYIDLSGNKLTVSTKAQHGMIAASLHDAYIILMNKNEYWNDKTYMKFFFNEDDPLQRDHCIVSKEIRLTLASIAMNIEDIRERLTRLPFVKMFAEKETTQDYVASEAHETSKKESTPADARTRNFTDRMLTTPFGKQYGSKIDSILDEIFSPGKDEIFKHKSEDSLRDEIVPLFEMYRKAVPIENHIMEIRNVVDFLLSQDFSTKLLAEKFLYINKKEPFTKFFSDANKKLIEDFLTVLFANYFEDSFAPVFRIIKSLDMKRFACAYIMKRMYLTRGDNITNFGYFFIRTIAKIGNIKM